MTTRHYKYFIQLIPLTLLCGNLALALEVKRYEELKKVSMNILKIHIGGVGDGYSWSNSILLEKGQPQLFCAPENMVLNAENFIDIIDRQIPKQKDLKKNPLPIEYILYNGSVDTFPCAK